MKIKKKIGLIGAGNMGTSIIEGLLEKKLVRPGQIFVYDKIEGKAAEFSTKWKVRAVASNAEIARRAEVILLAIKPQDLAETAAEFRGGIGKKHVLISILAGTPIKKIRKFFGTQCSVVRAMPNLGAKVGESLTALGGSPDALSTAQAIFLGCGKTVVLEEKHFDLVTALSGSGPAYFFYLMELMAEEGQRRGLTAEQSMLLAVQTALGAAKLADASGENPGELRKKVTSKGGTTEAALKILTQKIPAPFSAAIKAAHERGRELARKA